MFKAKIVDFKPHIMILNPLLKIAVSNIPMGKNCGNPPKIAENCGKLRKIAEIAEKLRTAIPPPGLSRSWMVW